MDTVHFKDISLSPYAAKDVAGAYVDPQQEVKFNSTFVSKVENSTVSSFSSNFELYLPQMVASGENFSIHGISIPGFIGSLNDSFLIYGIGDRFISDVASHIEHHFRAQGKACKVFSEGVNMVVCLEGKTPIDINDQIKGIMKQAQFKYEISLYDIPNTKEGITVKNKIIAWAKKSGVNISADKRVVIDLKTFERMVDGRFSKGIPDPKVGSFDVTDDFEFTGRQLKTKAVKLIDWVKFAGGSGKLDFEDARILGSKVDELISYRDIDMSKIHMADVLSDFYASESSGGKENFVNQEIFNDALELPPNEFSDKLGELYAKHQISDSTQKYLTTINDSVFYDYKYGVMNENAYEARINHLFSIKEDCFVLSGDITNLGGINREYGRIAGDAYLEKYFETWMAISKDHSIEGITVEVYRCGADEFGVIIHGTDDPTKAKQLITEFEDTMNKRTIRLNENMLTNEEKALLKNKGIKAKNGTVTIEISDIYRDYLKIKGGRFDRGSIDTIKGDHVTFNNKRSGRGENSRMKTGAKELKKGAKGRTSISVEGKNGSGFEYKVDTSKTLKFSSLSMRVNYLQNYFESGAPNSGLIGKGASIGYNSGVAASGFVAADAIWGLGARGFEAINGEKVDWSAYGNEMKNSLKGGLEFGALDGTLKAFKVSSKLAPTLAIGLMSLNDLHDTPEQLKGLAIVQQSSGLGSFIWTSQATETGLSAAFGYSTRTPGPWWIKAGAFGAGFFASKALGEGFSSLYRNNGTFRNIMNDQSLIAAGSVIGEASKPANTAFVTYTGASVIALASTRIKALSSFGSGASSVSKAVPVVAAASIGTYVVVGSAEHMMLDPYTVYVAERAKTEWKEHTTNPLAQAGLWTGELLTGPFMTAVTPEKYRESIENKDIMYEKTFMEHAGQMLLETVKETDTFKVTKGHSALPKASQFGPELKAKLVQKLSSYAAIIGEDLFKEEVNILDKKYPKTGFEGLKVYGEVTDKFIDTMLNRATVNGKPLALAVIEFRRTKK
jgi:GGDEF domain-containing protein